MEQASFKCMEQIKLQTNGIDQSVSQWPANKKLATDLNNRISIDSLVIGEEPMIADNK
jgi:hypothetical protein